MANRIKIFPSISHCGYCQSGPEDTFVSEGFLGERLTPHQYQQLLDTRWRRSGVYLYRPILELTCCPLQSIR